MSDPKLRRRHCIGSTSTLIGAEGRLQAQVSRGQLMSLLGQNRNSALPLKADIRSAHRPTPAPPPAWRQASREGARYLAYSPWQESRVGVAPPGFFFAATSMQFLPVLIIVTFVQAVG